VTIVAAADGSALGNPGPAGWAWYVDDSRWAAGGWPHGTNNQGELKAVIDLFQSTAHLPDEDLRILCDSQYVINAVTKWMPGWKRKGWRKADGSPVLNLELLKELDAAASGRRYTFEWVKGHAGHSLNEAADERARAVATAYQNGSAIPHGPGWKAATGLAAGSEAALAIESEPDNEATVLERELMLLDPAVRRDQAQVAELLHPRFEEIGSSGRLWSRDAMIQSIGENSREDPQFQVLGIDELSEDSILLTYTTASEHGRVLRSSLWLKLNGRWRLRFHQGTVESPATVNQTHL
jgi:ribonuclease HI